MLKKYNKILLSLIIIIAAVCYLFINIINGNDKFKYLKSLINDEQKQLIKKYILPYKKISEQQQIISKLQKTISEKEQKFNYFRSLMELQKKNEFSEIIIEESTVELSNNKTLKKYELLSGFYAGISLDFPGSGYIDFYEDNILVLSSRGVLAFKKNLEDVDESFKQIKNNINNFISLKQFKKGNWFSLKDLFIQSDKIFISYTEEIKEDCWNTSVIYADMNFKNVIFKKLFSSDECVHSINNVDKEFNAHQSGGKIISFDKDHILLSVGDYRSRYLAQDIKSINGKIIKVNIDNGGYEMISVGHRNPQGLFFDRENNIILETEHGPKGGDEVNLIDASKIIINEIQNYGWPISSAGEHYGGKVDGNKKKYEKYPLYKSHSEYGFIEPLYSFVPSIGISEIVKFGQNKYVLSSMADRSLYFFDLNESKQITNLNRVEVYERVRDLKLNINELYLFMENTASIGVLNLN